jgi:alkylhydroperoxidase/carboxymuconolactone decarboxylase family protein YurZ
MLSAFSGSTYFQDYDAKQKEVVMDKKIQELPDSYQLFEQKYEEVFAAYEVLGTKAAQSGPLDFYVREMIKLGMAAALDSEGGVRSHVHRLLDAGASPEELEHAVVVGVTTMGFPSMIKVLNWVRSAVEKHQAG